MADYSYYTIRWPWAVTASNGRVAVVQGIKNGSDTLAVDDYIWRSTVASATPVVTDFRSALNAAIDNALVAAGIALTSTVFLDSDGVIRIEHDGTSPGDDFDLDFTVGNSIEPEWLGLPATDTTFTVIEAPGASTDFQGWQQWHSGVRQVYWGDEAERDIVFERRSLTGKPIRIVQSDEPWDEVALDFERVASARMKDSRAADAAYAAVAGIAVDEPNTWENLRRYLMGPYSNFGDHRIYVYSSNIPSGTTQELGPYEVIMGESEPPMTGVGLRDFRRQESSEFYDVRFSLWRDPSL